MTTSWTVTAPGAGRASDAAAVVPLAASTAARRLGAATGLVLVLAGLGLVSAAVDRTLLPALVLATAGATAVATGLAAVRGAIAHPPLLRVSADHLTLVDPAALRAPLVLSRADVVTVVVEPVPVSSRRRHAVLATATAARLRAADPQAAPWSPDDLRAYLPVIDPRLVVPVGPVSVALLLAEPRALVEMRWSTALVTRLLRGLADPLPVPGRAARGLLLRAADPLLAAEALQSWNAARSLPSAEVARCAPARAGLAPSAIALGVAVAVVLGGLAGLAGAAADDPACDDLDALLVRRELPADVEAESTAPPSLSALLPATLPTAAAVDSEWLDRPEGPSGRRREWASADGGHVTVAVEAFATGAAAAAADEDAARSACAFANDAFTVPGLPGAVGLQVRTPVGVEERVSFLRAARRYVVTVGTADTPADHARTTAIAVAVAATAR